VAVNRDFLLRSLEDLEREREAGDLTDADYKTLKAEYQRRLKGIEPPKPPPPRPGLVVATVAAVLVFAVMAGVLVAQSAGRRAVGGTITGGGPTQEAVATTAAPASELPAALAECTQLEPSDAIACFSAYTDANPDDPAGFIQFGLFAINAGIQSDSPELLEAGETFLGRALELEPANVEAKVYLAVLFDRTGRPEEAAAQCEQLATVEVPADFGPLVDLACG
jgi:cytochrome c-type biogenesis protein CcmH/NrfG